MFTPMVISLSISLMYITSTGMVKMLQDAYDAEGWFSEVESDPEGSWEVIMRASGVQYNDQNAPIEKKWVVAQFSVVLFSEDQIGLALARITDQE